MMLPTYIISLPESTQRREAGINACRACGLEPKVFTAVRGKDVMQRFLEGDPKFANKIELNDVTTLKLPLGKEVHIRDRLAAAEVGCALSHLGIYQKMQDEDLEYALILEDDCELFPVVKELLPLIINNSSKWDVAQLAHNSGVRDFFFPRRIKLKGEFYLNHEGMDCLNPIFNRRRGSYTAAAYIIKKEASAHLLKLGFPVRITADYLLGLVAYNGLRIYTAHPKKLLTRYDAFDSTIEVGKTVSARPQHKLF